MKFTTAALALLPATLTVAAPAATSGYAVPSVLKIHDIKTNLNKPSTFTSTVRNGNQETSTLYDIPIPAAAAGRTCGLVFTATAADDLQGTRSIDFFKNLFTDLNSLTSGNRRDQGISRNKFNPATGNYDFVRSDVTPTVEAFPCPAGKVLHWEAAAVGDFDINNVPQDFAYDGVHVPHGLSVRWW
ncbi:hypothetical protein F5B22DRAFT_645869 [Xylaria bambusicola]|uniref:uncharacterized protein n=1 Tax=Xylaria bambusicola TaxID=326684 RepID=UPI0020086A8A|nr:uncharacterized protein F5B22DRAFT_645869 [Xylaria bambusicola]KAI0517235.1 hypothetical protein F5B22DRAFT_645869 [Xylaria bambusicola]